MTIVKNEKTYCVKENAKSWTLSINIGCVPVSYNIRKADCPTFKELEQYVAESSLF
jgi:hypothetical protein